jgi:pyruvate dehydrogenase (quinone)
VVSKTASEYLVEAMEKAGVKRVYGVIGDALNGFSDALDRLDPHAASVSR